MIAVVSHAGAIGQVSHSGSKIAQVELASNCLVYFFIAHYYTSKIINPLTVLVPAAVHAPAAPVG